MSDREPERRGATPRDPGSADGSHLGSADGSQRASAEGSRAVGDSTHGFEQRTTIPRPADEQVVYRVDPGDEVVGAQRKSWFDLPATIAGALAALGTLVLLSSLVSAAIGAIGYRTGVNGEDLSIGGVIGGLVVLFLACVVGGWVAGRIARHRGGLHGLVAALWLVLLAAVIAALAALFGDDLDITDRISLPNWFSSDTLTVAAIVSGVVALALMLLGGWLGGKLGGRHTESDGVSVVSRRHAVRERSGGIDTTARGTRHE